METFKSDIPKPFTSPTALPKSEEDARVLQEANVTFWETHPMRYDWKEGIAPVEFSKEFYEEIDRRFFENAVEYFPKENIPFDTLVHFKTLKDKDVLEIGVGNGSHAGLLSKYAKTFAGIDITSYAAESTQKRFQALGLKGDIRRMDAERLGWNDSSFDYVWSWGVIHHSSNTRKILEEIHRVLRPGGTTCIMVYYRGWWNYYIVGFLRGLVSGALLKNRSLTKSVQLYTDGGIARYYSVRDWRSLAGDLFTIKEIEVRGPKTDIVPLPGGRLKSLIMKSIPNSLNRFLTKTFRMGVFLIVKMNKK